MASISVIIFCFMSFRSEILKLDSLIAECSFSSRSSIEETKESLTCLSFRIRFVTVETFSGLLADLMFLFSTSRLGAFLFTA